MCFYLYVNNGHEIIKYDISCLFPLILLTNNVLIFNVIFNVVNVLYQIKMKIKISVKEYSPQNIHLSTQPHVFPTKQDIFFFAKSTVS